tara:strand:- start:221 stop:382 length:162 start_codon:yes stop_codon:yes gene_type:complete
VDRDEFKHADFSPHEGSQLPGIKRRLQVCAQRLGVLARAQFNKHNGMRDHVGF